MDNKFNFSSKFKVANIFSLILFAASILFILFKGLNYGIDFKGGTLIELRASNTGASEIRSALNNMDLGDVNVKKFGQEGDYIIKVEQKEASIEESLLKQCDFSFQSMIVPITI